MADDKIAEIRARHERDESWRDGLCPGAHDDRAYLLAEVDRLRAMFPPTAHSGVRNGPGEGSWSVFSEKVVEERDAARAEVDRLRAEIERLRAALTDIANQETVGPYKWHLVVEHLCEIAQEALEGKP